MTDRAGPGETSPVEALTPPSDPWAATAPPISPDPVDGTLLDPNSGGGPMVGAPTSPPGFTWPPTLIAAPVPSLAAAPVPTQRTMIEPAAGPVTHLQRRRRRWPWVMGTLSVLALACCGVGAGVLGPILQQHPARVSTPDQVAGLTRVSALDPYANDLRRDLRAGLAVDTAFAGVYAAGEITGADLSGRGAAEIAERVQAVIFLGATVLIWNPGEFLDQAIAAATNQDELAEVQWFDPGRFGGELSCGTATDNQDLDVVICAWVDHGSIGVTINYDRPMADSARLLTEIRQETLTRP